ncbi:hypothetical protein GALMADRAFT_1138907 [Galerina marginata CBS 339.88]|uniref:Uncharacterized protein n=1 Tax=Galerina marginata (strain CBS 339.88) TaxID=685588 RepID=A0A067SG38_GALM3|nr:hypothetical protein GALMADRAFT_1138907 [Galerina marginata CBS 339.88]
MNSSHVYAPPLSLFQERSAVQVLSAPESRSCRLFFKIPRIHVYQLSSLFSPRHSTWPGRGYININIGNVRCSQMAEFSIARLPHAFGVSHRQFITAIFISTGMSRAYPFLGTSFPGSPTVANQPNSPPLVKRQPPSKFWVWSRRDTNIAGGKYISPEFLLTVDH